MLHAEPCQKPWRHQRPGHDPPPVLAAACARARNTGAAAVEPGVTQNCQSAANPLRARSAVNLLTRGVMSIRMFCCPNALGLYASKFSVAVPLGISQMMASCQDSRTYAPCRMAL